VNSPEAKSQRLVALCLLGALLFNYPILALFNRPVLFLGIPLIYAYIFAVWAALIALVGLVVERSGR
jgi:uncharacterized membrane protein